MAEQQNISSKQLGGVVALLVSVFTFLQVGQGWVSNLQAQSYNEDRASLQQELNTQAKQSLEEKIKEVGIRLTNQIGTAVIENN